MSDASLRGLRAGGADGGLGGGGGAEGGGEVEEGGGTPCLSGNMEEGGTLGLELYKKAEFRPETAGADTGFQKGGVQVTVKY